MNARPIPAWFAAGLIASPWALTSCRHPAPVTPPPVALEITVPLVTKEIPVISALRPLDVARLDLDDFFPKGARPIGPQSTAKLALRPTPFASYPSTDISRSLDGQSAVSTHSIPYRYLVIHWMTVETAGIIPLDLYHSVTSFDTRWSPDSRRIAITDWVGRNRSLVCVLDVPGHDLLGPLDLSPALVPVFSSVELASPCFVKAYRWTEDGRLVVRGLGRATVEPFEEFGYEVLVDLSVGRAPMLKYLRGYTRESERLASTP